MRRLALALVLLALPAHADMYQDGSNAKKPEAHWNLGINYSESAGNLSIAPSAYDPRNGQFFNQFSTALGVGALSASVNTPNNTAIGWHAMNAVANPGTGGSNVAVGGGAIEKATAAEFATAVGSVAMRNSGGWGNSAYGHGAMAGDDWVPVAHTGGLNTAIGSWSFQWLKGGASSNTGLGATAGGYISDGTDNVAIGVYAGAGCPATPPADPSCLAEADTSGYTNPASYNTAVGTQALRYNRGNFQVGLGYKALFKSVTGSYSTALGFGALATSVADNSNIAVGYGALTNLNGGGHNVVMGTEAGKAMTTGLNNILIGDNAGNVNLTTGFNNVIIGTSNNCDTPAANTSNTIMICGGNTKVWSAIGTDNPLASTTTIAGVLAVSNLNASGGTIGGSWCATAAGVFIYRAGANCFP